MYFIGGTDDAVNPTEGTKEAYEIVHKIWKANKAEDKLKTELIEGGEHAYLPEQQDSSFAWLAEQFK